MNIKLGEWHYYRTNRQRYGETVYRLDSVTVSLKETSANCCEKTVSNRHPCPRTVKRVKFMNFFKICKPFTQGLSRPCPRTVN